MDENLYLNTARRNTAMLATKKLICKKGKKNS